jgi:hypothetical protein
VVELAVVLPVSLVLALGFIDFGRFAFASIAVTNAARAGAGAGIMGHYPDPDPDGGQGLANWQRSVCDAVADELGTSHDFAPAPAPNEAGYVNGQGLYVGALREVESGGPWNVRVTVRCPFTWWGFAGDAVLQRTVVYRAIR